MSIEFRSAAVVQKRVAVTHDSEDRRLKRIVSHRSIVSFYCVVLSFYRSIISFYRSIVSFYRSIVLSFYLIVLSFYRIVLSYRSIVRSFVPFFARLEAGRTIHKDS